MKCRFCGKEIANNSKFCEFCGAKVEVTQPPQSAFIPQSTKENNKKIFLGILIGVVVVVQIIIGLIFVVYASDGLDSIFNEGIYMDTPNDAAEQVCDTVACDTVVVE